MGNENYVGIAIALLIVTGMDMLRATRVNEGYGTRSCTSAGKKTVTNKDIIKSENDKRDYKYMTLNNELRLMLVSDPGVEKAAVAVSINAGFSSDPSNLPGLAHFCEHMLFFGTDKYPEDFFEFIGQHGGGTNAYTAMEFTTYFFNVLVGSLEPALDRFAHFFISPLFDANSTYRELRAIEQEYQNSYWKDSQRMHFIDRANSKPGHRYANFGGGNMETLNTVPQRDGIDIRKMLLEFYNIYYSANIMTVAIVGKRTIRELEKMAVPLFNIVKNHKTPLPRHPFPYDKDRLQVMLKIPTIREMNKFEMKFQVPDFPCLYRSDPSEYLLQTIGHEGQGSLMSLLKKKGLARSLLAARQPGLRGFELFVIGIDLTRTGLNRVDDIITLIFQYIKLLKKSGLKKWIYEERLTLDKIRFRFQDKQYSQEYAQFLVQNMHIYSPENVLNGHYLSGKFLAKKVKKLLNHLTPENFRYFVASKTFVGQPTNRRVKYYDTDYMEEKIPRKNIEMWKNVGLNKNFHLPRKNQFIPDPKELEIVVPRKNNTIKAVPVIIKDNEISRVWHKADDTFYLPKSTVILVIYSPHAGVTPSHLNHLSMFALLVRDAMSEFSYDAQLADVRYDIRSAYMGLLVVIDGFSSKQDVLLKKIFHHIIHIKHDVGVDTFRNAKQKVLEDLTNADITEPYRQTADMRSYVTIEKGWSTQERLQYMDKLTPKSLRHYIHAFLKNIYVEGLFCGNMLHVGALELFGIVENMLITKNRARAMLPLQHQRTKEFNIPQGVDYLYEKRSKLHTMSALQIYLQVGMQHERSNVLCELFSSMIYQPMFTQLRTKEQLGYIVSSGIVRSQSVQGIYIQVQTDKEPAYVEQRIDNFFEAFKTTLANMTAGIFNKFVEAMVVAKLEKPKQLGGEVIMYTAEIIRHQYHFRRAEKEVEVLRQLRKSDFVEFFEKYIDPSSTQRKKLAVIILGRNATSLSKSATKIWTNIEDVLAFKTSLPLYPHIMPYNGVTLLSYKKFNDTTE